ncbi:MAG: HAD-IIB family hydrolase [Pseudomonadota bacterium]
MHIVFSDLDGTLLDHHSYGWQPALPALTEIKSRNIPLVLVSSKTAAEMIVIRDQLGIDSPFIAENGSIVYHDMRDSPAATNSTLKLNDLKTTVFGKHRSEILKVLDELRTVFDYKFRGFSDLGTKGIADVTGLSLADAALANEREMSEPVQWEDSEARKTAFVQKLSEKGICAIQGGRFLSIQGQTDKSEAMKFVIKAYQQEWVGADLHTIALGDSPNDIKMLQLADIAVVVRNDATVQLEFDHPNLHFTQARGPQGWNDSVLSLISR